MSVTIMMNDNPQLLKLFKEIAKALNEPLKIKKQKSEDDFYNSPEMLEVLKEAKELKEAYLRGEVKYLSADEFIKESMSW